MFRVVGFDPFLLIFLLCFLQLSQSKMAADKPATKMQLMRGIAELRALIENLTDQVEDVVAADTGAQEDSVVALTPVVYSRPAVEDGTWAILGLSLGTWLTMSLFMTAVLFVLTWWYDKVSEKHP